MRMGDSLQTRGLGRVSSVCEGDNIITTLSFSPAAPQSASLFFSIRFFFFPLAVLIFEELIIYFNCSIWSYCPYCVSGDSAHPAPNVSTHRQNTERSLQSTFFLSDHFLSHQKGAEMIEFTSSACVLTCRFFSLVFYSQNRSRSTRGTCKYSYVSSTLFFLLCLILSILCWESYGILKFLKS